MNKKERYAFVINYFKTHRPNAETELVYSNEYELTVAVVLSAQCTDKRVNLITPPFFSIYPNFEALSTASFDDVFSLIKSCSYPNNKSKHLLALAQKVVTDFKGSLPQSIETLQTLPGIGRKTANVLASVLFNIPAMAVDTHVFRVSARIGLTTQAKNPLQAEKQLVKNIPENVRNIAHHWLILHGRYICKARKPLCHECGISSVCKYFETL